MNEGFRCMVCDEWVSDTKDEYWWPTHQKDGNGEHLSFAVCFECFDRLIKCLKEDLTNDKARRVFASLRTIVK